MICSMRTIVLLVVLCLSGCVLRGPAAPPGGPAPGEPPSGTAQPAPLPGEAPPAPSGPPSRQGPRQFHLAPAAPALVTQAHTQAGSGEYGQAAATLERALRIEPDNPLLWIELGRLRLAENNAAQADALGPKALPLPPG